MKTLSVEEFQSFLFPPENSKGPKPSQCNPPQAGRNGGESSLKAHEISNCGLAPKMSSSHGGHQPTTPGAPQQTTADQCTAIASGGRFQWWGPPSCCGNIGDLVISPMRNIRPWHQKKSVITGPNHRETVQGFKRFFIFKEYWRRWSNLTNIFQMGWNHPTRFHYRAFHNFCYHHHIGSGAFLIASKFICA